MKGNFHVQCGVGENLKITSKSYLSLWYKIAKKKKLTGAKRVAYVAGYVAVNSINPFKAIKKVSRAVKSVKRLRKVTKTYKRAKKSKVFLKKAKKVVKATYKKSKRSVKKSSKKVYKGYLKAKCKITKKGCFVEGTLILTENGLVPIEDIEIGDYVWAENPKTGEIELKEVLDTFEKQVDTIVTITVDGETIETTEAHVFYVENVGWLPASMLKQGDILHLEDGRTIPIESIETTTYNYYVNVYNFEVEDFHTYYVSDISVLVHNQGCKKTIPNDKLSHIFRKKEGHFSQETNYGKRLLTEIANNEKYYLGLDQHGNGWYAKITRNGKQIWVRTKGNHITDGGINKVPKKYNPRTGLCKDIVKKRKEWIFNWK